MLDSASPVSLATLRNVQFHSDTFFMAIISRCVADVRDDSELVQEMLCLLGPSYEDPKPLLGRELGRNTQALMVRDERARLRAFFLVGWHVPPDDDDLGPLVYLGLSAARIEDKSLGLPLSLYHAFLDEAKSWEVQHNQQLLLWGTTALPLVWRIVHRTFANVRPGLDGEFNSGDDRLMEAVLLRAGFKRPVGAESFILRGVSADTRYTAMALAREEAPRRRASSAVFDRYRIDEAAGDRLAFLAGVPQ